MPEKPTPREIASGLAGRHHELVRFLRTRLPNDEDARDLAQEAYLRLLRLSDDHVIRHPEAYLFRIASNLIHEYWLTSRIGLTEAAADPDELPSQDEGPDELANRQEALSALKRAIGFLPAVQQTVVLMHRCDGKTYNEIARELDISRDMVKKHLAKGLARCQKYLVLRRHGY